MTIEVPLWELLQLPFFVMGKYQTLFFGTHYHAPSIFSRYLHTLFSTVIPETYVKTTLDELMTHLRTQVILFNEQQLEGTEPYVSQINVMDRATRQFRPVTVRSLAEIINIEMDVFEYERNPYGFSDFEITRHVPYILLFDALSAEKKSAMELTGRGFFIYLDYFRTCIMLTSGKRFHGNAQYITADGFADWKTETVVTTQKVGVINHQSLFNGWQFDEYMHLAPSSALPLSVFMVGGVQHIEYNHYIFSDARAPLLNHAEYISVKPLRRKLSVNGEPDLVVRTARLFQKQNKLLAIAILIGDMSVPNDEFFNSYSAVLDELALYTRSERFFFIACVINLRFVKGEPIASMDVEAEEDEDEEMESPPPPKEASGLAELFEFLYDSANNGTMTPFVSMHESKLLIGFYLDEIAHVREITFVGSPREALRTRVGRFKGLLAKRQEHSFVFKKDTPQRPGTIVINVEPNLQTLRLYDDDMIETIGTQTKQQLWPSKTSYPYAKSK